MLCGFGDIGFIDVVLDVVVFTAGVVVGLAVGVCVLALECNAVR